MKRVLLLCLVLAACSEQDHDHDDKHPAEVVKVATLPDGTVLYKIWDVGRPIYFTNNGGTSWGELHGRVTEQVGVDQVRCK